MSTSARIAFMDTDGTYKSIFCHYDGYLEILGETLNKSYSGIIDVIRLVEGGNISSINESDKNVGISTVSESFEDLITLHSLGDEFFLYVFEDNTWTYIDAYGSEIIGKQKTDMKDLYEGLLEKNLA